MQIKKKDVDKMFSNFYNKERLFHAQYKLSLAIQKCMVRVSKATHLSSTPPNYQLIVKGITPPLQVDLCASYYDNVDLVSTNTFKN